MPRIYTVSFASVAVTAVQDLISVQSTSGMAIEIHEIVLGQVTATSIEALAISLKRFSGAYTIGSGGSAATPAKHNFGDSAATATGRVNDTTKTTGGTSTTIRAEVFNEVNGFQYLPAPDDRPVIAPSQAFVLSLDGAPAASRTVSGALTFAELF